MYTRDIFTSPLDTSCPSDIGSGNWFYTNDTSTGEMISSKTLAFTCTSGISLNCSGVGSSNKLVVLIKSI